MLLLNLAIGYALLSLHGLVHAPPLLLTRLVASAQDTATHEDPEEVAEQGRDEWVSLTLALTLTLTLTLTQTWSCTSSS